MLALALHFLNGWAMAATDGAKKAQAEWPPHPDRVFMALAAAYFENDDGDKVDERAALEWLESLPPPAIAASDAEPRRVVTHYVPVNDAGIASKKRIEELSHADTPACDALKQAGLSQLPEFRGRQPRSFPVAIPHHPIVHLIWPDAQPSQNHKEALKALCCKTTHVGHSASLVHAWIEDAPPPPRWIPGSALSGLRLRVPCKDRLAYLSVRCGRDQAIRWADMAGTIESMKGRMKSSTGPAKKTLKAEHAELEAAMRNAFPDGSPVTALDPKLFRPEPGIWQGYFEPQPVPEAAVLGRVFDPNLVILALSRHRLGLRSTLRMMAAIRNACMAGCAEQPPPEWLSGHGPDGKATAHPHAAFIPLPFVGDPHADGRLMGVAIALPVGLDPSAVARCLGGMFHDENGQPRAIHLFDGEWFDCVATLETRSPPLQRNLRNDVWIGPSRFWSSVTPVALDRHFDGSDKWERAAESIKTACERSGLPRPTEVLLGSVSRLSGVPRSSEFPYITRKSDGGRRHHSHATLIFEERVVGPLLVGAGRFRGYGLFRPLRQGGDHV
jgi:CRISPR-associated protein Csb2